MKSGDLSKSESMTESVCPLCGESNACGNLLAEQKGQACWCMDPAISFSAELLERVAEDSRGKACICRACALGLGEVL